MAKLRPIGHEDRLSVVDHLDELRGRLIICAIALTVAFAVCFWQNHRLLDALNSPLKAATDNSTNHIGGLTRDAASASKHLGNAASLFQTLSTSTDLSTADSLLITAAAQQMREAAKALPQKSAGDTPITTGVGEPFTTSLTVSFYFALLITLPVILYQLYAFVIPALSSHERSVALPIMLAAPLLFVMGVVFTFFVVLPPAVKFLQGYNSSQFQALVQAKPLYSFEVLTMGAIGLAFQMPLALFGLRALGIINGSTLTRHWRYATVILAVIAAAMPGADPVTTALETAPLVLLFLASIVLLKYADRREAKRAANELAAMDWHDPDSGSGSGSDGSEED
jgi:sec-independent protein translocase protein TatC